MTETGTRSERRRHGTVNDVAGRLEGYRRPMTLATTVFAVGIVGGVLGSAVVPAEDVLPGIAAGLPDLTVPGIFLNNLVVLAILLAGTLTLGVGSGFVLFVNGGVLGYVAAVVAAREGLLYTVLGIAPHGIVEIPAFLLGGAVAFRFGGRAVARLRGHRDRIASRREYRDAALLSLAAAGLLLLAAVVEVYVTGVLVEAVVGA